MNTEAWIKRAHPASHDARWCLERYYAELDRRFNSGFDPSASMPAAPGDFVPPSGAFLVAVVEGRPVGCGAVKSLGSGVGSIKRMWVSREMRGFGLGRRILSALEEQAIRLGLTTLRLETHPALKEAIGLYKGSGYEEVEPFNEDPYAGHWFEKRLDGSK